MSSTTIFSLFHTKSRSNGLETALNELKISNKQKSQSKNITISRYSIPNTGRICFSSSECVSSLFQLHSKEYLANINASNNSASTITKKANQTKVREEAAIKSLIKGKEAAKTKLSNYGDEWAEEEELPGFFK